LAGFKDPPWNSQGGWRCYITNIIKEADRAEKWNAKGVGFHNEQAKKWAPVLRWQLEKSKPKLVVMMGTKVEKLVKSLTAYGLIKLPAVSRIHHYSYIAFRPEKNKGPMHPERIEAYNASLLNVRKLFDAIK